MKQGGLSPSGPWFNEIAAYLGPAYLRNAFTQGTAQEVEFLIHSLGLAPGMRVLDVGCGPGRHAIELARHEITVVGVDLSEDFIALARAGAEAESLPATFSVVDVRDLSFDGDFDAVICLCQGGFGLLGGAEDAAVVARLAAAVRPGGMIALTAFHSYFALRFIEPGEDFDPVTGVLHELATLRNGGGAERVFDLWTTCFTAREMTMLAHLCGLDVVDLSGVAPGRYRAGTPSLEDPELLLLARRRNFENPHFTVGDADL